MGDIRQQNRRALEKNLFELTAAYQIGTEASCVDDLKKCLKVLVDRIADLMSVKIVSVMLMDPYQRELVMRFARGLDEHIIKEAKVKLGEGVAGWIAKTGEPLLIKDIGKDSRFPKRKGRYTTNSLLSVPLKVRDRVIGVINVNNKISKDVFREEDLDILKTVADLAAVAIESARIRDEAKTLDTVRVNFLSDVSHELRAPLVAVKEAVSIILDGITGEINDRQRDFLERTRKNIERLGRLIDELLRLARAESASTAMVRRRFDIVGVIEDIVASFAPLASNKQVKLIASLPKKTVMIWADADKIHQVLTNLIDNAIKYNKPKGRATIGLQKAGDVVMITVADTGMGIPADDLPKVFDRFFRATLCAKGRVPGTGIGLSITRDIIMNHGGEITVDSRVGAGTVFTVRLPVDFRK